MSMKNIHTIPPDVAFVDSLAQGLWEQAKGNIFTLSETLILLPTRRSCRLLREAFLRCMDTNAALLPRMQPLGDMDEEELYFTTNDDLNTDIPPALAPLRRQLLLTRLIAAKDKEIKLDQAAQLAEALAQFLDQAQTELCSLDKLAQLVQEKDLAEHWQETVRFLEILTEAWPTMLAAEGCIDPADRRNRVLQAQAAAWRTTPPAYPIIAAGSTGSIPATAELLDVIASLPLGKIILPGLDQDLDEEAWQAIGETHPQSGMKRLLEKTETPRRDVKIWGTKVSPRPARVRLLQESMRPADVTEAWQNLRPSDIPPEATSGLTRLELDHPQEEAQTIALLMRSVLETPNKTAALVTADRGLAERVLTLLARWNLTVNDSAGASLATQPIGAFLIEILKASAPQATAVDLASLLKHPFTACGLSPATCRAQARQIEISVWRKEKAEETAALHTIKQIFHPLASTWHDPLPLLERLQTHISLAEELAKSDQETGAARLWHSETGETAAEWLDELQKAADDFPPLTGADYTALFANLLRKVTVRPAYGQHPRLTILGPLEARLIQADTLILGGLNEGNWPPQSGMDPWMSRPMKQAFGLPSPERRLGLSAHDFVQLASAPDVILTRSKRADNAPTVPSRFLLQLDTVLQALGYSDKNKDALASQLPWQKWAQILDEPDAVKPCDAPNPCPPVASRPQQLSVTEIGTWRRNPYAIYAKHILKLRKLDPLDAEIDAADRGTLIHEALDAFVKIHPETLPPHALDELLKIGRGIFAAYDEHPEVKAFWWPRFERIAVWFIDHEQERRAAGTKVLKAEADGYIMLGDFKLKGRADRVDQLPDGTLEIVDYKTGGVPSQKEIKAGYEPQLPLLSVIAACGGFTDIKTGTVSSLAYWKLSGGREAAKETPVTGSVDDLAEQAHEGLENLIEAFAHESRSYQAVPKPRLQPRYNDYAHLARLLEWGRTEEEE